MAELRIPVKQGFFFFPRLWVIARNNLLISSG
jgi:hypothetical protein